MHVQVLKVSLRLWLTFFSYLCVLWPDRKCFCVVFHVCTGCPMMNLIACFASWNSVYLSCSVCTTRMDIIHIAWEVISFEQSALQSPFSVWLSSFEVTWIQYFLELLMRTNVLLPQLSIKWWRNLTDFKKLHILGSWESAVQYLQKSPTNGFIINQIWIFISITDEGPSLGYLARLLKTSIAKEKCIQGSSTMVFVGIYLIEEKFPVVKN